MISEETDTSTSVADFEAISKSLEGIAKTSKIVGRSITSAFADGVISGKRFQDVVRSVGLSLSSSLLKSALKPLETGLSGLFNSGFQQLFSGFGGLGSVAAQANGGVVSQGVIQPFANGGVISSPAYFPLGRGLGLMGERGAEAILPLARGADGKLGVRAGEGGRSPTQISVQVVTRDAESFRGSEAQVSAAIARAVARGQRAL
jgi:lambda family phage tail tape measure protein